jgi:type IV secretory pathway VirB10-like protein
MSDDRDPPVSPLDAEPAGTPPAPAPDLRLRGRPPRVMRLSRKTLAAGGAVGGLAIAGALMYALGTGGPRDRPAELYNTDNRPTAEGLAAAPKDYAGVPRLGPPLPGDLGPPILSAQQRGVEANAPPIGAAPRPSPGQTAADAAQQRVRTERDAARTSKLFSSDAQGAAAGPGGADAVPMAGAPAAVAGQTAPATPPASGSQASKRAFLATAADRQTVSAERLAAPVSSRLLQAGSVIPAALITGLRSDLPGQVTAQVTQNVYDSLTGRLLLIPQGSRLIGNYDSDSSFGQKRVLLAWDRLILPDGRSITLDRQPGADATGQAGLEDRTNHHWGAIMKAALVSTMLGVGTELSASGDDELTRAVRRGTQDSVDQVGRQIVGRQLDIQPTLTIRPGYPVRVIVTRDLILE